MALVFAYVNRGITKDFVFLDADGDAIAPGANDQVRATILHEGQTAKLTVASDANGPNGSTFQKGTPNATINRLTLVPADLQFDPGTYSILLDFFDNASGAFKVGDRQVFVLEAVA